VCTSESPCQNPVFEEPSHCESEAACRREATSVPATLPAAPTQTSALGGNHGNNTDEIPPPPTRAQLLAAAIKSCKQHYKKKPRKRRACEARARKSYGAAKNSAHRASRKGKR
jgi:hypothetical protein